MTCTIYILTPLILTIKYTFYKMNFIRQPFIYKELRLLSEMFKIFQFKPYKILQSMRDEENEIRGLINAITKIIKLYKKSGR